LIARGAAVAAVIACAAIAMPPRAWAASPRVASLEDADRAWSLRAEGASGELAAPGPVAAAIAAYEQVLAADPQNLEAIWKLERALHYRGAFTRLSPSARARVWERGTELAERSMKILHRGDASWSTRDPSELAAAIEDRSTAAAVHFWAAIHWGLWGETKGALPAVRKGIAKRIRDHALASIALDETIEHAGGHRLIGRLHAVAPRVPLFTGWVDREEAIRHLSRAVELAPDDLYNRLYLAEAELELRPQERARVLAELESIVAAAPDPELTIESARARSEAREILEAEAGE
jgi:tetratricopeptide (TPR) repeat protein